MLVWTGIEAIEHDNVIYLTNIHTITGNRLVLSNMLEAAYEETCILKTDISSILLSYPE